MISLIVGAVATSEILEPESHLTVVGIDDCRSISVHHTRQIKYHIGQFHSRPLYSGQLFLRFCLSGRRGRKRFEKLLRAALYNSGPLWFGSLPDQCEGGNRNVPNGVGKIDRFLGDRDEEME